MNEQQTAGRKLLRLPLVLSQSGAGRSTLYKQVNAGLFTSPVKIGARACAWPASEVDALVAARIAGKSETEIKELVAQLESDRLALA